MIPLKADSHTIVDVEVLREISVSSMRILCFLPLTFLFSESCPKARPYNCCSPILFSPHKSTSLSQKMVMQRMSTSWSDSVRASSEGEYDVEVSRWIFNVGFLFEVDFLIKPRTKLNTPSTTASMSLVSVVR